MLISMHVHGGSCFFHAHDFSMVMAVHACSWWFMWFMCFSDMFMFQMFHVFTMFMVVQAITTFTEVHVFFSMVMVVHGFHGHGGSCV